MSAEEASQPSREFLVREYVSAGSWFMLYADRRMLDEADADGVRRLTERKRRTVRLCQLLVLAYWVAAPLLSASRGDAELALRLADLVFPFAIGGAVLFWLQRIRRSLRDCSERLIAFLRSEAASS